MSKVSSVLRYIFGILTWIIVLPSLYILCRPFLILRLLHVGIARLRRKDLTPLAAWQDIMHATNLNLESSTSVRLLSLKLKGEVSLAEFRTKFNSTFFSTKELRKEHANLYCDIVQWGAYAFKRKIVSEDELDLNYHIRLGKPDLCSCNEFETFMGSYLEQGMKQNTPCWEILLFPMKKENCTYLVFKMHQGFWDSFTERTFLEKLVDKSSVETSSEKVFVPSFKDKVKAFFLFPSGFFKLCWEQRKERPLFFQTNPDNKQCIYATTSLPLEKIQQVADRLDSNLQAVLGGLVVSALKERTLGKNKGIEFPAYVWISSSVDLPNHPLEMGNYYSINYYDIPTNGELSLNAECISAGSRGFEQRDIEGLPFMLNLFIGPVFLKMTPLPLLRWLLRTTESLRVLLKPLSLSVNTYSSEGLTIAGHPVLEINGSSQPQFIKTESNGLEVRGTLHSGKFDITLSSSRGVFETSEDAKSFLSSLLTQSKNIMATMKLD